MTETSSPYSATTEAPTAPLTLAVPSNPPTASPVCGFCSTPLAGMRSKRYCNDNHRLLAWAVRELRAAGYTLVKQPERQPAEVFHPGSYLRDELKARGMSQYTLAEQGGISAGTVQAILSGRCGIGPKTAAALAKVFGTSAQLWLNLQAQWNRSEERKTLAVAVQQARETFERYVPGGLAAFDAASKDASDV